MLGPNAVTFKFHLVEEKIISSVAANWGFLELKVKVLVTQSCPTLCDPHGL